MFTTILGIPAHPLLIHAAVVFVPLLIAGAVVYAVWPAARHKIDWAVFLLAIVSPFSVLFARLSGENLRQRLIDRKLVSPEGLVKIDQHQSYGQTTLWWTIGLAVVTLLMLGYARSQRDKPVSKPIWAAFIVVTLVLSAFTGYYIFRTGDTGAHSVWQGF